MYHGMPNVGAVRVPVRSSGYGELLLFFLSIFLVIADREYEL